MSSRRLDVLVNDRRVGQLSEANDLWAFEYDPAWAAASDSFDLSPALHRHQLVYTDGAAQRPVQWYFDNLLPEEALRTVLAKEAQVADEDAFGLLAHFGAESAGSLVLRPPGAPAEEATGLKPLSAEELNQRILQLPKVSLTKDAPKRMSLAGAQHKMVIVLRDGALFEPLPGTPSTHILKPNHPSGDYPASVMNEYFTMKLAAALGLDVAKVQRRYLPEPVYIVERFDRVVANPAADTATDPPAERLHIIDTCQLLNKSRTFKYVAANLPTLADAITQCRTKASARRQLYRWMLFNVLVGNGDNHLKNVSFRVTSQGISVAPAYDLLCTGVYETKAFADEKARWPHVPLALSLGEAKSFDQVNRAHLVAAGETLGLTAKAAERELDVMVRGLPAHANRLVAEIESAFDKVIAQSPDPQTAGLHRAGELRLLRAIVLIVLPDTVNRLRHA